MKESLKDIAMLWRTGDVRVTKMRQIFHILSLAKRHS